MTLTLEQRFDLSASYVADGRLMQRGWHRNDDGRELACMLGSFGQDINSPGACPADLMPPWMAHLIPRLFDGLSPTETLPFARRFGPALRGMVGATDAQWRRVMLKFLRAALGIALPHDRHGVVRPVIDLIDRELRGDVPSEAEWLTAAREARRAWTAAVLTASAREADAAAVATADAEAKVAASAARVAEWVAARDAEARVVALVAAWVMAARALRIACAWGTRAEALLTAMEEEVAND
mgnify:CR=1 FL=1